MIKLISRWALGLLFCLLPPALSAQNYPLEVIDVAGRTVTLHKPPERIFLQDGNDLLTLALLDRENPFARLAGWNNVLGSSDPSIWALLKQRWPLAAQVPDIAFDDNGSVDQEALLRTRPDLLIAQLSARAGIESTALAEILQRLDIPLVYVDLETDPLHNTLRSVELLGQLLDREERAEAYSRFYREHLAPLTAQVAKKPAPRVFMEIRAGQSGLDHCCFAQGRVGWGLLIEAVGGRNLAADYLTGNSGDIALETLIRLKPDAYLMTGSQRQRSGSSSIPLGYQTSDAEAQKALVSLMQRHGMRATAARPQACVHALYHQFYKSVFNIVGLEYLAGILHPGQFQQLNPAHTYRQIIERFTELPSAPILLEVSRSFDGTAECRTWAEQT